MGYPPAQLIQSVDVNAFVAVERRYAPPNDAEKRMFDVILAGLLIVLLAPVLLLLALSAALSSRGPALFGQPRVGRHGQVFTMLKFRTMQNGVCDDALESTALLRRHAEEKRPHDPRVTRLGHLLRTSSLDELPQLWNVLRGDMSLVGPRPLPVWEHVARRAPGGVRLSVRPGLTGPWQVLGRSEIPFAQRMILDAQYARDHSLSRDLKLLARTIPAVLGRRGAY